MAALDGILQLEDQHHVVPTGNFRGDTRQMLALDFSRKL